MGGVGGGGFSTSESDQLRPLMLPQEVEMLHENDLIVFRRGMYATYCKTVRYFAEKKRVSRTKIPAPDMSTLRSVEQTCELQSLLRLSYTDSCLQCKPLPTRLPPTTFLSH